jgi:2-dehydro-3-deoxyphosphooctonate aldolase (KDO 8-P synthase)
VAQVCDIVQIPAFLCRQTDLLVAAAQTDKIINVKKAQFLSGQDMKYVVSKIEEAGNNKILLTERGSMYGYNNLVVDYTGILDMMQLGYPVMMDATHSVQKPGGAGGKSGGNRAYAPMLARAAAAIGVKGFFIETHPRPDSALSDGPNMIYLNEMYALLQKILRISDAID